MPGGAPPAAHMPRTVCGAMRTRAQHLFADLVGPRRSKHNWVTGAVIAEVRGEMLRANRTAYRERVFRNHALESTLRLLQEALPTGRGPAAADAACVSQLETERRRGLKEQTDWMNPHWGSVFHADDYRDGTRELSLFGFALRRHADVYMSELQNIAHYAARGHRFVPRPVVLPHEVSPIVDPVVEHVAGSKLVGS